ncbi:hypothetical protein F5B22DRAFT_608335 [Xylaria bambusicola]|uniref:uncharacterized protein n=1 Tax=Xylaria bambusicola TaxID=326684 RepID=UPI002008376F|nr:uncharacterized protein F5B22DRAFT_608335 [Xylaria bambusicola]KAI0515100.1 hypothetical protein F5B22DRAFT_608335 [Xylaria bambusicola]
MSTLSNSFEGIGGRDVFAGNHFSGPTSIAIHQSQDEELPDHRRSKRRGIDTVQDQPQPCPPTVCRYIPFLRNEGLVPRDALTTQLNQLLPSTPGYRAAALWGLGGSGKTQVALNYVYERYRDPLCSVFWVHADSEASFTQDYETIARKLKLGNHLTGKDLLHAVCDNIECNPNWVLVLDEVDNLTLFGVGQLQETNSSESRPNFYDFIPKLTTSGTGTVLWTSRDQHIAGSLVLAQQAIHVVQMTAEEGISLLSTVRNQKTEEDEIANVRELLSELDHLPLAISQAAAYIRRTSTPVGDYLADIRGRVKKRWKILGRSEYDQHRREHGSNSFLETWSISIEYLRRENGLIYDIMHCLAFVDNQNIPYELISEIARISTQFSGVEGNDKDSEDSSDDESSEHSSDELDVRDAIARLCEFEFLKIRPSLPGVRVRVYDMHKLVQEAARYLLKRKKDRAKDEAYFAKTAFKITDNLFPVYRSDDWDRCEQYQAHAQQAGMWAELHDGQLEVVSLLKRVSDYLVTRGRDREAEVILNKALILCQKTLGDRHERTLLAMIQLGHLQTRHENLAIVEKLFLCARQRGEEALGANHHITLVAIIFHADAFILSVYKEKWQAAEVMLQHILTVVGASFDIENPTTVENMFRLAKAIIDKEKHGDTVNIWRTRCGPVLHTIQLTGKALLVQKKYKEAEDIFQPLLALCQEMLGMVHSFSSSVVRGLGMALSGQKKFKEAEELYSIHLTVSEEAFGGKDRRTMNARYNLGLVLDQQEKFKEAEDMFRQVVGLLTEALGRNHPHTLESVRVLACVLWKQRKYKEAEDMFRQVVGLQTEVLGRNHPDTLQSVKELAWVLWKQGKYEEAEELARDYPQQDQRDSC